MLTKKDLEQIDGIMQRRIKDAFQDFYEHIFEPYADKNENEHLQMVREIKAIKKDTEEIKDHVRDHERRLTHLEEANLAKN